MMNYKKMMSIGLSAALSLSLLTACGGNNSAGNSREKQVVIYSNADEEAVTAICNALVNRDNAAKIRSTCNIHSLRTIWVNMTLWRQRAIWKFRG